VKEFMIHQNVRPLSRFSLQTRTTNSTDLATLIEFAFGEGLKYWEGGELPDHPRIGFGRLRSQHIGACSIDEQRQNQYQPRAVAA
jgi:hypothetical protein